MRALRIILLLMLLPLCLEVVGGRRDLSRKADVAQRRDSLRKADAAVRRDSLNRLDSLRKVDAAVRRDSLNRLDSLRKADAAVRRDSLNRLDSIRRQINHLLMEEPSDSLSEARNERLFDSLESKASRNKVSKLLYDLLVTDKPEIEPAPTGVVVDQSKIYKPFRGRRISRIKIERLPVFDSDGNWFERAGNNLHVQTRERVIRRDLMFEVGDTIDPDKLVRNMQLLNSRSYISNLAIHLRPDSLSPGDVILEVLEQDSWTISVDGRWGGDGETMFAIFDDNIMGWGTHLRIETNFDRRDFSYGGNVVQYNMPNIGGSFYTAEILAGREFQESTLHLSIGKDLIQPTDYGIGASYMRDKRIHSDEDPNNIIFYRIKKSELWGGYSHEMKSHRMSIYTLAHFSRTRFKERPEVDFGFNPAYHEGDELLASLGIYREHFLTTNMIYGYGTREYIGAGYRAGVIGGYHWGEYHNGYYFGAELLAGDFLSWGYAYAGAQLGSYLRPDDGAWFRSVAQIDLRWFSNLIPSGQFHIRQLAKLNYTQGWNRLDGSNETINFNDVTGIRSLKDVPDGVNRCCLNTETVLFTPYQPWGFRVTLFGFADFGLLGKHANPFQNHFYSAIGVGVRIKNERLIFGAIQLQLGLAFGKGGLLSDRWYSFSSQRSLNEFRYRPTTPNPIGYE